MFRISLIVTESAANTSLSAAYVFVCMLSGSGGLPRWLSGQESACTARHARDGRPTPGSGRPPGEGNGRHLQDSCRERSRGPRRPAGFSPQSRQESDVSERQSGSSCTQADASFNHKAVVSISQASCRRASPRPQARRWSPASSTVHEASLLSLTPFVPVSALFVVSFAFQKV